MKKTHILTIIGLLFLNGCSQSKSLENEEIQGTTRVPTHSYGGWYCPDNLNGFPPVNIANWSRVPVISDRLTTEEEARSEASLIYVDTSRFPSAKVHKMALPQLARFYTNPSKKEELVIIIQAIEIQDDTIVGFRYLNGGNGSARLREVNLLNKQEEYLISNGSFVSFDVVVKASPQVIWQVLTSPEYALVLQPTFDPSHQLDSGWWRNTKHNYIYANRGIPTASFAGEVFGSYYIQNDFEMYTEKFLLLADLDKRSTTLKVVCGPFTADYNRMGTTLQQWAQKVKTLSEGQ